MAAMDRFTMLRTKMVDSQLRTQNVTDLDVLAAMSEVPREHFLPPGVQSLAYIDEDIQIKEATDTTPARYMMEPAPFARMLQLAGIVGTDIVLDIGCGCGYSAAVLARLADSVVALESDPELAEKSSEALVELGVANVAVVTGPLEEGYPSEGPYDVIFLDGAVERVPEALLGQLKEGGRLVAPVGVGWSASVTVYTRSGGEVAGRAVFNAAVQPLPGFRKPAAFVF
jgi:protein-L-isoaspartate(D-aspartate) O-methyltransferase